MTIGRKQFLAAGAGALSTFGLIRFPGEAAEYNLKFSTAWSLEYVGTPFLQRALDDIRSDTGGRVDIQLFPNSMLGGQAQEFTQLRAGSIDMITGQDNTIASVVPIAGIYALPFIFKDTKEAMAAATGPLGKYRRAEIAKANLYPFEQPWNLGLQEMMNSKRPIVTPDDMKGLKMRTPESKIIISTFSALGASPTAVSTAEVYTSLQTHLVDGIAVPLNAVIPYKFYEVTKYVSYTNNSWTSFTVLANGDLWRRLPQNVRDTIDRRINEAGTRLNDAYVPMNASLESDLKKYGMVFNQSDIPAFRTAISRAGLYAQWRNDYGSDAWTLLEQAVGPLA